VSELALVRKVLQGLSVDRLRKIARDAKLVKRGNSDDAPTLLEAIVEAQLGLRSILEQLKLPELREVCTELDVSARGRKKDQFVKRLLEYAQAAPGPATTVECDVWNDLPGLQPIFIGDIWRLALVQRLIGSTTYSEDPVELADLFRDRDESGPSQGRIAFRWEGLSNEFEQYAGKSEQDHRTTEHAALALACVSMAHRANKQITEAMDLGDGPDYWLGNREEVLEVGGKVGCDLDAFRDEKRKQLLGNAYGKDGYICVVDFAQRRSYLLHYCQNGSSS